MQHIITVGAGWFSGTHRDEDAKMAKYTAWRQVRSSERTAAEMARGLGGTRAFLESRLQRWSPEDLFVDPGDERPAHPWYLTGLEIKIDRRAKNIEMKKAKRHDTVWAPNPWDSQRQKEDNTHITKG